MMAEYQQDERSGNMTRKNKPVPARTRKKTVKDYFRVAFQSPFHFPVADPYLQLPANDFPSSARVKVTSPAWLGAVYEGDSDQVPVRVLPEIVPLIRPSLWVYVAETWSPVWVNSIMPQSESHEPDHGVGAAVAAGATVDADGIAGVVHPAVNSPITMTTIIKNVPYLAQVSRGYRDITQEISISSYRSGTIYLL
jgi:hypothetical protein